MWARNGRWILPEMPDCRRSHAVNLRHGTDGFTSPPKEGVLRIFSPWKIRRLRPGLNPRTWVPKASTLGDCQFYKNKSAACCWLVGWLLSLFTTWITVNKDPPWNAASWIHETKSTVTLDHRQQISLSVCLSQAFVLDFARQTRLFDVINIDRSVIDTLNTTIQAGKQHRLFFRTRYQWLGTLESIAHQLAIGSYVLRKFTYCPQKSICFCVIFSVTSKYFPESDNEDAVYFCEVVLCITFVEFQDSERQNQPEHLSR